MNSTVFNKSNKLLIPIIIVLLIPMVFAIYFATTPDADGNIPLDISAVNVEYGSIGLSMDFSSKEDVNLYKDAVLHAKKITSEYRDVSKELPFIVSLTKKDGDILKYEFYMKFDREECIYKTTEGDYYLFLPDDAGRLLNREEFQSINKTATVPFAFAGLNNVTIMPTSGEWSYLNADGQFSTESISDSGSNQTPVKINANGLGSLTFGAKTVPDSVSVALTTGTHTNYEGAYENMLNSDVMSANDIYYNMQITATWDKKEDTDYYGTVVYNTQLFYDVSPTYNIIYSGNVTRGDFGIIKINNFNQGEKLYVSCDFPLPAELKVFTSPLGYSFAFLPVEYWTQGAVGTYDVTLSLEDGSSQVVKMRLKDSDRLKPASSVQEMLITDIELSRHFSEEAFAEFNQVVAELTESTENAILWEGKFIYPNASNKKARSTGMGDYGTLRTVNASGLFTNSYYHNGFDFAMEKGENVLASNGGKVVFASELTLSGNTVIIDHGCSILTYYGHLDTINVKVGDTVSKSDIIGTAGSTGFAIEQSGSTGSEASQVHFAVSIEGRFVTPYYLWYGGVDFND